MMTPRAFTALITGKAVRTFCRIVKRGGTAKPGKIALKICPDLLKVLSSGVKCTVITGTNGKTTCTRIVEEGFHDAGLRVFANRSGANLIEGITTDFIVNSTLRGKCRYDYAVLECDEAASKNVCLQLQPEMIFVTNLFRDQVDRFGDVTNTRDWIRAGIQNAPGAVLVLNGDCPVTASLAEGVNNRAVFYGFGREAAGKCTGHGVTDLSGCPECGGELVYDAVTFSHLGAWRCKKCGRVRPQLNYTVENILSETLTGSTVSFRDGNHLLSLEVNLPAIYNIYNAAGAYAALKEGGAGAASAANAVKNFRCGFGRMERFDTVGRKGAHMILVKNDAGCNQVLSFLSRTEEDFILALYINNNISDGRDISWLEEAEFESLADSRAKHIYVSGMCAEAVHTRLCKAGLSEDMITVQTDCAELIRTLGQSEDHVFIIPNYTGMMETRSEIVKQFGGTEFWED